MCSCICILHKTENTHHWDPRTKQACVSPCSGPTHHQLVPLGYRSLGQGPSRHSFPLSDTPTGLTVPSLAQNQPRSCLQNIDQQWSTYFAYRGISSSNILNIVIYTCIYICNISFSAYRISREKHDLWHRNPFTIKQAFIDELPGIFHLLSKIPVFIISYKFLIHFRTSLHVLLMHSTFL